MPTTGISFALEQGTNDMAAPVMPPESSMKNSASDPAPLLPTTGAAKSSPDAAGLNSLILALEKSQTSPPRGPPPPKSNQARKKVAAKKTARVSNDNNEPQNKRAKTGKKKATVERTSDDFDHTIDGALSEGRIDAKKATRLRDCLKAGDWSEVAYSLLCEQIPLKRKGKGYCCRICQVPKKGHNCPYCHVCSIPDGEKFKKEHDCFNCSVCYLDGKRNKKLVQVRRGGPDCPHGPPSSEKMMMEQQHSYEYSGQSFESSG
ncbi:hypothetical protein ACHAXT_007478 [Thalassiosira profunda]